VRVGVAASEDWQTVVLDVPATGKVVHVRLFPSEGAKVEISRIELSGVGASSVWNFAKVGAPTEK
jgi:hypothetical protein